ncbi:type II toxin-antitoxin system VapC family toxin [Knoellia sp. CPCC 206453]|uniref:type II toxin-antitoxin system VapC family toxin n=1 Tax=Knoellia pratensis TaxID=3404796 RepID=UPI00360C3DD5
MILLDTNVISEVMRGPRADRRVLAWVRSLDTIPVTTVINRAEILAGIAVLPSGQRRDLLEAAAHDAFDGLGVCLPVMPEAASAYARIVAERQGAGHPVGAMDALVAAIATVAGATVATRDVADFADLGLPLINPWE